MLDLRTRLSRVTSGSQYLPEIDETKQIAPKNDAAAFPRVKTFARLQLTDEELDKWL